MKRTNRIKGFTLVECIVAMAILGVTSLLICQAYSQMMRITRENNNIYHSLSDQMKTAETRSNAAATATLISGDPVEKVGSGPTAHYAKGRSFVMSKAVFTQSFGSKCEQTINVTADDEGVLTTKDYTTQVNIYLARPYKNGAVLPADSKDDGSDIRYVYFYNKE